MSKSPIMENKIVAAWVEINKFQHVILKNDKGIESEQATLDIN